MIGEFNSKSVTLHGDWRINTAPWSKHNMRLLVIRKALSYKYFSLFIFVTLSCLVTLLPAVFLLLCICTLYPRFRMCVYHAIV